MSNKLKIALIVIVIISALIIRFFWIFFGNPYPRLHLIGTEYIVASEELHNLNNQQKGHYFLTKKYKYSESVLLLGYGGGGTTTNDYYGLGIADNNKKEILPSVYEYIVAVEDYKTNEIYIVCTPFFKTGSEPNQFYKIENNKAIPIKK